jgi:hypothetical protein
MSCIICTEPPCSGSLYCYLHKCVYCDDIHTCKQHACTCGWYCQPGKCIYYNCRTCSNKTKSLYCESCSNAIFINKYQPCIQCKAIVNVSAAGICMFCKCIFCDSYKCIHVCSICHNNAIGYCLTHKCALCPNKREKHRYCVDCYNALYKVRGQRTKSAMRT